MEITKNKKSSKICINTCLLDSTNQYVLLSSFMQGDADGYKDIIQTSGKKITKEFKNLILALEVIPRDLEDITFMKDFIEIPYSEFSYWSFEDYKVVFIDKNKDIFECNVAFNEVEEVIIKANTI